MVGRLAGLAVEVQIDLNHVVAFLSAGESTKLCACCKSIPAASNAHQGKHPGCSRVGHIGKSTGFQDAASTGKTPSQYILQARLRKARELIIYTALPIYAIAEECGFQSPSYFTSRFRQMFGIAPQAYRKRFE
ncbi:MAG: helix-turn-helix transcriptional regulator [Clostridiales bacterium]|nr:helix-turn-helix transcriptional regulator [Clostridiales bacterium]